MEFFLFQNVCLQPASDQANQTRVPYSVLHKAEHPFVTQAPEKSSLGPPPKPIPLSGRQSPHAVWPALDGHLAPVVPQTSTAENPARKLRRGPERRFSGAPGQLHKERPKDVSPAFRVLGYTLAECLAPGIPGGAWIAAFHQSIPQSSPLLPVRFVRPPRERSPSESDIDSPKLALS